MTSVALEPVSDGQYKLVGDVVFSTTPGLLATCQSQMDFGQQAVLNCKGVGRIDSACLALFVALSRLFKSAGGQLKFFDVPAHVMNVASLSGLSVQLGLE